MRGRDRVGRLPFHFHPQPAEFNFPQRVVGYPSTHERDGVGYPSTSIAVPWLILNIKSAHPPFDTLVTGMFHPGERPGRLPFHPQPSEFNLPQRVGEPKHGGKERTHTTPPTTIWNATSHSFPLPAYSQYIAIKDTLNTQMSVFRTPATGQLSCFTL